MQRVLALKEVLAEVEFRDWEIQVEAVGSDQLAVRWAFQERDNMKPEDETLYPQYCRWWLIERNPTRSSVLKTLYLAAQQAVQHEFQEQFKVNGVPLLDPHAEVGS